MYIWQTINEKKANATGSHWIKIYICQQKSKTAY
jgi:hypothetical protein